MGQEVAQAAPFHAGVGEDDFFRRAGAQEPFLLGGSRVGKRVKVVLEDGLQFLVVHVSSFFVPGAVGVRLLPGTKGR